MSFREVTIEQLRKDEFDKRRNNEKEFKCINQA